MSLQWKMHTNFPFTRVLVLGIFLFFLGLASMIISIIAFVTQSWGHYVGTGMWGGSTILFSGLTAIFSSRIKSLASVKTFSISSLIATFTSLTMLILSAGGLTLSSGFYTRIDPSDYNKRTSNLIHASLLVISVFCLSGNILALIVCCKYIFFEHHEKPKHRRRHRNLAEGSARSSTLLRGGAPNTNSSRSTNSRTLLQNDTASRRHSDNTDVNRVQIEYRRSHRRTASDQLHSNSRRQRHSHQETGNTCSNNSNLLSPGGVRYYLDRRNNRGSSQGRDVKDLDRLNIQPLRNSLGANGRPGVQATMQVRLSRSPVTHEIRLPTEFDEEELPPYEAVESRAPADENIETASDSGDESDTENSSSTEAESYNVDYGVEGAESFPMVPLQNANRSEIVEYNSQNCNSCESASRPLLLNSCTGHQLGCTSTQFDCAGHHLDCNGHQLEQQSDGVNRSNKLSNSELPVTGTTGTMVVRKDSSRSNRPVLSYINTNISDQLGDYERLVSVSPEVCAITGESPELHHERHSLHENFYENGPCYENIRCVGRGLNEPGLNYLSKSPSSKATTKDNYDEARNVSTSGRNVQMQVLSISPPLSPSSPPLSPGNIGSSVSAFRPVVGSLTQIEHSCINDDCSAHNPTVGTVHLQPVSSPQYRHESMPKDAEPADVSSRFKEQGAIPKTIKSRESVQHNVDKSNLTWKNILLPLSYNHSDSASNEGEKKLPSKNIPFTDSNTDISKPSKLELSSFESSKLSPRVYPLTAQNLLSSLRPAAASSMTLSAQSRSISIDDNNKQTVQPPVPPTPNPVSTSVKEASTQASSVSRWHSHRMGGTQSLLQSRRDEMQNSHLSRRALELSTRSNRPSSMPAAGGVLSVAASPVVSGRTEAAASPPNIAEAPRPLSLRSYLVNPSQQIQHSQSLALRQNHLLQHYPLQPQQPRLGVQLHQRRHQQHQLQQNIESQQQLQQQQQQQQGNEQQQQLQQARNGRPLFSVLL